MKLHQGDFQILAITEFQLAGFATEIRLWVNAKRSSSHQPNSWGLMPELENHYLTLYHMALNESPFINWSSLNQWFSLHDGKLIIWNSIMYQTLHFENIKMACTLRCLVRHRWYHKLLFQCDQLSFDFYRISNYKSSIELLFLSTVHRFRNR